MTEKRKAISVLFANPNALTRDLVMQALNRRKDIHVVATATTAREVLDAVRSADVDVALISATLSDSPLSGIGVLRQISEQSPKVRSVVLYYDPECHIVADAFRAGARGIFYFRRAVPDCYTDALSRSMQGRSGQTAANLSR